MKYIVICLGAILFFSCSAEKKTTNNSQGKSINTLITSNLETVEEVNGRLVYLSEDVALPDGDLQTDRFARSGKYSIKIDAENPFGLSHEYKDLSKGSRIEVTIWQHINNTSGNVIIYADGLTISDRFVMQQKGDWALIYQSYILPEKTEVTRIFLHNPNPAPAFFDDITIKIQPPVKQAPVRKVLKLNIPESSYKTLADFRDKALEKGVITDKLKDYVPAYLWLNNEKIPVKIRLKGDWPDHLKGAKWSYRIKMPDNYAYKGMTEFSLQSPHTRAYMMEWLMHRIFQQENVLSTKYFFQPVSVNGAYKGIYAIEEHFEKQLIERHQRREGPLLKINEEGFWSQRKLEQNNSSIDLPFYEAADVDVFSEKRIRKNEPLREQFLIAQDLLYGIKRGNITISDALDGDLIARYYALSDLGGIYHGLSWHNQRFYYNPITAKLEPIAFDNYPEHGINSERTAIIGRRINERTVSPDHYFHEQLFNDPGFLKKYESYLKIYSDTSFVKTFIKNNRTTIDSIEQLIQSDYTEYHLNSEFLITNAMQITSSLDDRPLANNAKTLLNVDKAYQQDPENDFIEDISLIAYWQDTTENSQLKILMENYHTSPITIIGYSLKGLKEELIKFNPVTLKGYKTFADTHTIYLPPDARRLHFTSVSTGDKIHRIKMRKLPKPGNNNLHAKLREQAYKLTDIFQVKGHVLSFRSSSPVLSKPVYIPEGYRLSVKAGTQIDLTDNAFILSYGPVQCKGTRQAPIVVSSSDSSSMGLIILGNKKDTSVLEFTGFSKFKNLQFSGWQQTGSVVFYNTNAEFSNCYFRNNTSEDALNMVRCNFSMEECFFEDILSDGFDADFCVGQIRESNFYKIGNDAVDVSGGRVNAHDVNIERFGDKGFSCGENGFLYVNKCNMINGNIAIASKDNSRVQIEHCGISACKIAYAVYEKKPEYGPASISVHLNLLEDVAKTLLIDKGSKFVEEDDIQTGNQKIDVDALYQTNE